MARPAPQYRENPQRAVYVLGRIDEQNVYRVLPEITRLRGESFEPITVYIHSPGGSTWYAEEINARSEGADSGRQDLSSNNGGYELRG